MCVRMLNVEELEIKHFSKPKKKTHSQKKNKDRRTEKKKRNK